MLAPLAPDPQAALARFNPVAKLAAAAFVMAGLLLTLDAVTPAVLLAMELAGVPASGVRWSALARRTWPLLVGVAGVTVANLLIVGSVESAAAVSLRLLGIALPGILVLASTDPMDLADALVQRLHVSPRFAYGALAALRLLPLLAADWHQIARARRARGLDAGWSPIARVRLGFSQVFAVLVGAIRRAVRLARAMEARGFDAGVPRTIARPQPMRATDWALVLAAVATVGVATTVAMAAGTWSLAFT